jgi:beta-glucosidase
MKTTQERRRFMSKGIGLVSSLLLVSALSAQQISVKDKAKIDALMKQMTVDEKIGQLNQVTVGIDVTGPVVSKNVEEKIKQGLVGSLLNTYTPSAVRKMQDLAVKNSRLHIPLLFGYDVIHGHKTIFPIAFGLSATWDTALIEKSAHIAAKEASADGLNWTFSPMVDITRDPRWGRVSEGAGEDPYLGSVIAKAMVKGYQGNDLSTGTNIMACVKHFALYGAAEAGRDYNTVDMSRIRMFQEYLPPYKAAIDAGAGSVMTSFNEINGVPATGNKWLMTDLLRKQWNFSGFVVTDYGAINEMVAHGTGDLKRNVELAFNAGVDMDMVGEGFLRNLKQLLQEKKITIEQLDKACRNILEAKAKMGLFDDPYKYCNDDRPAKDILTAENRNAAREVAEHSFVLLKNNNQVLPLQKKSTIALVGPLADDKRNTIGSWSAAGDWKKSVSVLEGFKNVAGSDVNVLYAKGSNLLEDDAIITLLNRSGGNIDKDKRSTDELINEAVAVAQKADVVVAVLGETQGMTGEAACRTDLNIPDNQKDLLKALVKTGKPIVLVLMNGRPLTLKWENEHVNAILETWFAGSETGNAIANVLFGNYNPAGKLTQTFPVNVGQVPIYYAHKNTGRPFDGKSLEKYKSRYIDAPNDPLYPFGYGLSYTTFGYGDVKVSAKDLKGNQTLHASVTVTNTGKYAGEEVVQLYITDPVASVTRPVKELKNFKKIMLQPGESKEVAFDITTEDLKFYNEDLKYTWEAGDFIVHIGTNSSDVKSARINWVK